MYDSPSTLGIVTGDGLGREQIVRTAIELPDADGVDGLNMRRLGSHLGSGATSVYWHVGNKDNLMVRIDTAGVVTLRYQGRLHHIGVGRPHAGTDVLLLVLDRQIRIIINNDTGRLLREL